MCVCVIIVDLLACCVCFVHIVCVSPCMFSCLYFPCIIVRANDV